MSAFRSHRFTILFSLIGLVACGGSGSSGADAGLAADATGAADAVTADAQPVGCAGATCCLVPQSGCAPGDTCDLGDTGKRECREVKSLGEAGYCSPSGCGSGLSCFGGLSIELICHRFCESDAQCNAGPGSRCVFDLSDPAWGINADMPARLCTIHCDPASDNPVCRSSGADSGCEVSLLTDNSYATICRLRAFASPGTQGTVCGDFYDCEAGYTCASDGVCRRYCRIGEAPGTCPATTTCAAFSPAALIGTVEYGECW